MSASVRKWSIYVSGVVVFVAVGLGIPLLLLERMTSVLIGLPATPVG